MFICFYENFLINHINEFSSLKSRAYACMLSLKNPSVAFLLYLASRALIPWDLRTIRLHFNISLSAKSASILLFKKNCLRLCCCCCYSSVSIRLNLLDINWIIDYLIQRLVKFFNTNIRNNRRLQSHIFWCFQMTLLIKTSDISPPPSRPPHLDSWLSFWTQLWCLAFGHLDQIIFWPAVEMGCSLQNKKK